MGINNRQRRRAKQQHRRTRPERPGGEPRSHQPSGGQGRVDDLVVQQAVLAAADAFRFESRAAYEAWLELLRSMESTAGRARIDGGVAWCVDQALDRAWGCGWQPADVIRVVGRGLSARHVATVAAKVAASGARRPEAVTDGRWAAQVAAIEGDARSLDALPWPSVLALAVEAVSLLLHLPRLPSLGGPASGPKPGMAGRAGAILERVRALLAKAESTTFPEEAEALTAKAQALMARHAIDEAMLEAGSGDAPSGVVAWRIGVDDPYAGPKSILLGRIARANRCRAVWSSDMGFSTVFGHESDLETTELLFTSLLVQGTEAMVRAGRSVDHHGRSRTRSFRQSFLLAYAARIGERLEVTAAAVVAEGTERHGDALLPVLATRADAVEDAVRHAYPHLAQRGMSITNHAGWVAGRAAAELASLRVGEELATG